MPASPKADIVLLTVNKHETNAVLDEFKAVTGVDPVPVLDHPPPYTYLGTLQGARIALLECGQGSHGLRASAITVEDAIRLLRPRAVIAVGIAFGLKDPPKQQLREILISLKIAEYEMQRVGKGKGEGELEIRDRGSRPDASSALINLFNVFKNTWKSPALHFGLVLSGEKLVDEFNYRQHFQQRFPDAIGGEMEGSGLYVACHRNKVDWIIVKAISDWGDGNKKDGEDSLQVEAATNAARLVAKMLAGAPVLNHLTPRPADHEPPAPAAATLEAADERQQVRDFEPPQMINMQYFQDRDYEREKIRNFIGQRAGVLCVVHGSTGMGKTAVVLKALEEVRADTPGLRVICIGQDTSHKMTLEQLLSGIRACLSPDEQTRLLPGPTTNAPPTDRQRVLDHRNALGRQHVVVFLNGFQFVIDPATRECVEPGLADALALFFTGYHRLKFILTTQVVPKGLRVENYSDSVSEVAVYGLSFEDSKKLLLARGQVGHLKQLVANEPMLHKIWMRCGETNDAGVLKHGANPHALHRFANLLENHSSDELFNLIDQDRPDEILPALARLYFEKGLEPVEQLIVQVVAVFGRWGATAEAIQYVLLQLRREEAIEESLDKLVRETGIFRNQEHNYKLHEIDQKVVQQKLQEVSAAGTGRPVLTWKQASLWAANYFGTKRTAVETWEKKMLQRNPVFAELDMLCQAGEFDRAAEVLAGVDEQPLRLWREHGRIADEHKKLHGRLVTRRWSVRTQYQLGKSCYYSGDFAEGIKLLEPAYRACPESLFFERLDAGYHLARCYYSRGDFRALEVTKELREEIDRQPVDSPIRADDRYELFKMLCENYHGLVLSLSGRFDEAIPFLNMARDIARSRRIDRNISISYCNNYLAIAYRGKGEYGEAEKLHLEGIDLAGGSPSEEGRNRSELAKVLCLTERYSEAIAMGDKAAEIGFTVENDRRMTLWARQWMAIAHIFQRNYAAAQSVIDKTLNRDGLPGGDRAGKSIEYQNSLPALEAVLAACRPGNDGLEKLGVAEEYANHFLEKDPANWRMKQTKLLILCTYLVEKGWRRDDAVRYVDTLQDVHTFPGARDIMLMFLKLLSVITQGNAHALEEIRFKVEKQCPTPRPESRGGE